MKASTTVSTTFAATHDRHQVGMLVSLAGDQPVTRPPINVAFIPADIADDDLREDRADLLAEAERLKEQVYRPEDRKYHMAQSAYAWQERKKGKAELRRKRPQP